MSTDRKNQSPKSGKYVDGNHLAWQRSKNLPAGLLMAEWSFLTRTENKAKETDEILIRLSEYFKNVKAE